MAPLLLFARLFTRALRKVNNKRREHVMFTSRHTQPLTPGQHISFNTFQSGTTHGDELMTDADDSEGPFTLYVADCESAVCLQPFSAFTNSEAEWIMQPGTALLVASCTAMGPMTLVRLQEVSC